MREPKGSAMRLNAHEEQKAPELPPRRLDRSRRQFPATKQAPPPPFTLSQMPAAASLLTPPTRTR